MSSGWSVGDIVQAVRSLNSLIQALGSVNGAARDYREAIGFLSDLSNTLKPLQQSEAIDTNPELQDAIQEQVMAIKEPVEQFLQEAGKFEESLGTEVSKASFRTIPRKLQWHYSTSSRVKVLRDKVDRHMRILDTLLQRSTAGLIYQLPSEMRAIFHEVLEERLAFALQKSLQPLEANIMAQWSAIDSAPEAIVGYLHDHDYLEPLAKDAILETIRQHRLEGMKLDSTTAKQGLESAPELLEPLPCSTQVSRSLRESKSDSPFFIEKCLHRFEDVRISRQIICRLGTWWRSAPSLLWIQEPERQSTSSPSDIGVVVISLAKENDIPVFFHACRPRVDQMGRDVKHDTIFLELVESLLEQIKAVPQRLIGQKAVQQVSDVSSLSTDTMTIVRSQLNLIQYHISQFKASCMFVVDGLNYLDYSGEKDVEAGLASLLEILYPKPVSSSGGGVKSLLTTQGQSICLIDRISFQDKVDMTRAGHGDEDILLAGLRRESGMNEISMIRPA